MNHEILRSYCLSLPEVRESFPFGEDTLVFKVGGKVFLLTSLDESAVRFTLKCDPERAQELRERYPSVQPGYHMNKKHWNTVYADGSVTANMQKSWIKASYELVRATLPLKVRTNLSAVM